MPELPEVESVRRTLMPGILDRRVAEVLARPSRVLRPDLEGFRRGVTGRRVTGSLRRGKLLVLTLEDGGYWAVHLGMTGQLILAPGELAADHVHARVVFGDGGPGLHYRDLRKFGYLAYYPDRDQLMAGLYGQMGPDALTISAEEFVARLAGRKSPIKSLLLDQRRLAGVGNIYADESLHRAGIHPQRGPAELSRQDLLRLHASLVETLDQALAQGGSSVKNFVDAEGRAGTFQEAHRVYRRTGQPCPACGAPVERVVLGGRSTHFCPVCQR
ncbi:MAG: bifunctional DNA-formamidopyrimidine glycosylase/DNA-(apurinic or apyrimidinic site) lyase [Desulfarculus sp.]|nr:bifunctional DNA-formamidopyrimidine glycosylase/DNA-(apurinic or apyrimidinic site) lyase [Desulfarculus sp.]